MTNKCIIKNFIHFYYPARSRARYESKTAILTREVYLYGFYVDFDPVYLKNCTSDLFIIWHTQTLYKKIIKIQLCVS